MSKNSSYLKPLLAAVVGLVAAILTATGVAAGLNLIPAEVFLDGIALSAGITTVLSLPLIYALVQGCVDKLQSWRDQRSERLRRETVSHDFSTRFDVLANRLEILTSTSYSMGIGSLLDPLVEAGVIDHAARRAHDSHLMTINAGLVEIRNRLAIERRNTVEIANYLAVHVSAYLSISRQVNDSALAHANSDKADEVDTDAKRKIDRIVESWSGIRDEVNRLTQDFSASAESINGYLKTDAVRVYFERIETWPKWVS